jgi:Holliday junction resolvase RusA-like endonuclease
LQIEFFVKGKPQGKARPRFTRQGHTYTPSNTKAYETMIKTAFLQNFSKNGFQFPIFEGINGVAVDIVAYFEIPKSWSKKKRAAAIEGRLRPTVKPDTDNIAKIVLDSLNGLAYDDDKQVVQCFVSKWYGDTAGVSVKVREC